MVSIHAPREGRDKPLALLPFAVKTFQSTRPVRGATVNMVFPSGGDLVSIHAPREGRDLGFNDASGRLSFGFNPRAP